MTMERIAAARTWALVHTPFFGSLLMKMEVTETDLIPTMAVTRDGHLLFNPEFVATLTGPELSFVLYHEVLHVALGVFARGEQFTEMVVMGGRLVSLWNVAHDYVVNDIIKQMVHERDVAAPQGILWNPKYRNWACEDVYVDLRKEAAKNPVPVPGPGQQGQSPPSGTGQLPSPEGFWGANDVRPDLGGQGGQEDQEGGDDEKGQSDSKAPVRTDQENDQFWRQALVEASIRNEQSQNKGEMAGSLKKIIDEILTPKVSWASVLSRWVGENGNGEEESYARLSRRSWGAGVLLPANMAEGYADVCVLVDTSGSMNGREKEAIAEVFGICEDLNMQVRVICCDWDIQSDITTEDVNEIDIQGGGGSSFLPAFSRLDDEQFEGVVVAFTDGYIDVPQVPPRSLAATMWVIGPRDQDPTHGSWGEVLRVDAEGYAV